MAKRYSTYSKGFRVRAYFIIRGCVSEPAWLSIGGFGFTWGRKEDATVFEPDCERAFISTILAYVEATDDSFDPTDCTFDAVE